MKFATGELRQVDLAGLDDRHFAGAKPGNLQPPKFCCAERAVSAKHPLPPKRKNANPNGLAFFLVGEGGFEPPKAKPADLQSVPFGHSGTLPNPTTTTIPQPSSFVKRKFSNFLIFLPFPYFFS